MAKMEVESEPWASPFEDDTNQGGRNYARSPNHIMGFEESKSCQIFEDLGNISDEFNRVLQE